ncbi:hypothetical protein Avbf_13600 [Armadillidium vulgare]|nr:hypothetical protein Avbf_13600 [Armadillidium vulgare]
MGVISYLYFGNFKRNRESPKYLILKLWFGIVISTEVPSKKNANTYTLPPPSECVGLETTIEKELQSYALSLLILKII